MKENLVINNTIEDEDSLSLNNTKKSKENLIKPVPLEEQPSCCQKFCSVIFPCFKKVDTSSRRIVHFSNKSLNKTNWSNQEENNKYNILTFLPLVLFNQFKQFGNFFYLIMSISQFIPELKIGFLFAYVSPLAFVVCVSMAKELYDDINRRIQDKKTNSTKVEVLVPTPDKKDCRIELKSASDLLIGDIIQLKKNCRVPADIIVLKTFNESNDNQAFIRTDQLDGETDWKLRKAPGITQQMEEKQFFANDSTVECEPPSKLIYNFEGVVTCQTAEGSKREALNLENTMWASTVVASMKVIGIIIYTGKETRARMNSSTPKVKIGILDQELNKSNVYLFVIMVILSLFLTCMKGFSSKFFFIFFKYIVLFCAIIPISLRVNLDVSKTYFSYFINKDDSIPETIARNSTIPEELGRISYVFSDKTGTLTKNEMVFKKIAMETEQFGEENFNDLNSILSEQCQVDDAPLLDIINSDQSMNESAGSEASSLIEGSLSTNERKKKRVRRNINKVIRDTITSMVLCNNVTPIADDKDLNKIIYQAFPPDEVALIKFAETLKMRFVVRIDKEIKIIDSADKSEEFEILPNFPFSSDIKRMGIVLKNKKYGHIIYYLKGAENVMMKFEKKQYISYITENEENLATKGLRRLVLSQKIIFDAEFNSWNEEYKESLNSMDNRKERIPQVVSKLENNMEFLCVTGVEVLMQDDAATTIDNLRNASMDANRR